MPSVSSQNRKYRTGQTNKKGKTICGSRTNKGKTCQSTFVYKNGRCRMHGGKALSGTASPTFKHGKYSKYLPTRMLAAYEEFSKDPDYLALRDDIVLVNARITDLLSRVDAGEAGRVWQQAQKTWFDLRAAVNSGDETQQRKYVSLMDSLIGRGGKEWATWGEIFGLMEQKRKLAETERKRIVDAEQMLTTEHALMLVGAITGIIKAHIKDPVLMGKIATDIRNLTSEDSRIQPMANRVSSKNL